MRKPRQSEENEMQLKTGVKNNKAGVFAKLGKIFAKVAKISQPKRKFRKLSENAKFR